MWGPLWDHITCFLWTIVTFFFFCSVSERILGYTFFPSQKRFLFKDFKLWQLAFSNSTATIGTLSADCMVKCDLLMGLLGRSPWGLPFGVMFRLVKNQQIEACRNDSWEYGNRRVIFYISCPTPLNFICAILIWNVMTPSVLIGMLWSLRNR